MALTRLSDSFSVSHSPLQSFNLFSRSCLSNLTFFCFNLFPSFSLPIILIFPIYFPSCFVSVSLQGSSCTATQLFIISAIIVSRADKTYHCRSWNSWGPGGPLQSSECMDPGLIYPILLGNLTDLNVLHQTPGWGGIPGWDSFDLVGVALFNLTF